MDVNEELKFWGKFKKEKKIFFWGGGQGGWVRGGGRGVGSGGTGLGGQGGCE